MRPENISILRVLKDETGVDISPLEEGRRIPCPVHGGEKHNLQYFLTDDRLKCWSNCGPLDPVKIICMLHRMSVRDARKYLIEKYNVEPMTVEEERHTRCEDFLEEAVETWHKALTPELRKALHARSISDEIIESQKIGFCRPGAVLEERLIEMGLMKKGEACLFNDQYILPGFYNQKLCYILAGSPVTPDHWKYLKPPSSHIPQHVIGDIGDGSEPVLLVEGYFDMLSALQTGFPCVCTLGASPTKEQKKELSRIQNLIICFDSDDSGRKAAEELAFELFPAAKIADLSALRM
ncbi:MAG: toprim domain-containing protein [Vulcanimicrobiota bacterium]